MISSLLWSGHPWDVSVRCQPGIFFCVSPGPRVPERERPGSACPHGLTDNPQRLQELARSDFLSHRRIRVNIFSDKHILDHNICEVFPAPTIHPAHHGSRSRFHKSRNLLSARSIGIHPMYILLAGSTALHPLHTVQTKASAGRMFSLNMSLAGEVETVFCWMWILRMCSFLLFPCVCRAGCATAGRF